ncbi:MAG: hypothetical protein EKK63_10095 [Acinetobacter sp.]|uniref:hypothetical protein n=1 Tax=Acinetobacter sp. TaxID=472 RepID=UPI000FC085D2|nr:hypothetical protein [Acinetobacter sp.]RUP39341.1 MAG: hypothetical protein EKK63_10095 [Acinetobacter sp.]
MTDTNTDPFQTEGQVNPLDYAKTKFSKADGELDVEALARGKYESDTFIEQLKQENAQWRQKAEQGIALKDLMEAIKSERPNMNEPNVDKSNVEDNAKDTPDINEVVQTALAKAEAERKEAANKSIVVSKLNEVWGSNVGVELKNASNTLGIPVADLEQMGKRSPQALFKLLGVDAPRTPPSGTHVPTSTVNIGGGAVKRTASWYRQQYKANPALRQDSKFAVQEMNDAIAAGEAFFD